MENKVGTCPICEINVYDRGKLNRPFPGMLKRIVKGYPAEIAMPCGINKPEGRCPFETPEEQAKIEVDIKNLPKISGNNNYQ